MAEVNLTALPIADARARAATGAPVFLFANPVEYHGPHLSLENDALVSRGLARDLHARLRRAHPDWPFLVTADLGMGCAVVPGPGSRPTPFLRERDQVLSACEALVSLGARRVVLMTFHGDPLHNVALQAGVRALQARGVAAISPMNALVRTMMTLAPGDGQMDEVLDTIPDAADRAAMAAQIHTDVHAGFGETSLSLHYAPRTVSPGWKDVPPCPPWPPAPALRAAALAARLAGQGTLAAEISYGALLSGWMGLRPFPGYTGRPGLASAEAGERLARLIVDGMADACLATFDRGAPPPEPVMAWLAAATLHGRVYEVLGKPPFSSAGR